MKGEKMGITSDKGGPSEVDREFVMSDNSTEGTDGAVGAQDNSRVTQKIDNDINLYNQEVATIEQAYMDMKHTGDVRVENDLVDSMRALTESRNEMVVALTAMREAGTLSPSDEAREARIRYDERRATMAGLISQK